MQQYADQEDERQGVKCWVDATEHQRFDNFSTNSEKNLFLSSKKNSYLSAGNGPHSHFSFIKPVVVS